MRRSPKMRQEPHRSRQDAPEHSSGVVCLTPHEALTQRVYAAFGAYPAVCANSGGGQNRQSVLLKRKKSWKELVGIKKKVT